MDDNETTWTLFSQLYPKENPYASLQRIAQMTHQIGEQGLFWVCSQLSYDFQRTYHAVLEGLSNGSVLVFDPMVFLHLWNFLNIFYIYLCVRHPFRCLPTDYLPEILPTKRGGILCRWNRKDKQLSLEFYPECTESNSRFTVRPLQGDTLTFHCPPDQVADSQFVEAILAELCSSAYYPPEEEEKGNDGLSHA